MLPHAGTWRQIVNRGWKGVAKRNYFTATDPSQLLDIPFACVVDGCGLVLMLTRSYQPLGMLSAWVDGVLVATNVSASDPAWARNVAPKDTVLSFFQAVRPRVGSHWRDAARLARGAHTLRIAPVGATTQAVARLGLPTNYEAHEVHVRGLMVTYKPLPAHDMNVWDGAAPHVIQ